MIGIITVFVAHMSSSILSPSTWWLIHPIRHAVHCRLHTWMEAHMATHSNCDGVFLLLISAAVIVNYFVCVFCAVIYFTCNTPRLYKYTLNCIKMLNLWPHLEIWSFFSRRKEYQDRSSSSWKTRKGKKTTKGKGKPLRRWACSQPLASFSIWVGHIKQTFCNSMFINLVISFFVCVVGLRVSCQEYHLSYLGLCICWNTWSRLLNN